MDFVVIFLIAVLYAGVVFCICYFKKLRELLSNLISRKDIRFLRENSFDPPVGGNEVDPAVKDAVNPILLSWRLAQENQLPDRMDKTFLERMQTIIRSLQVHGVRRDLRLFGTISTIEGGKKQGFKKWNEGGREWREGTLSSTLLDTYIDPHSGKIVQDRYFPNVKISVVQSRHIRYEDAKQQAANQKDKFGYMKKQTPEAPLYAQSKRIICKSCGAEVEINTQQVTCPYCGGQLFSQFHDWQTEHFSVEPIAEYPLSRVFVCTGMAFASSFLTLIIKRILSGNTDFSLLALLVMIAVTVGAILSFNAILNAIQKKRKQQIVRFSEHQFKRCDYEELWQQLQHKDILDFFLGDVSILNVKNTEQTTELSIRVPLFTQSYRSGAVVFEKTKWEGSFTRARYPERLKSTGAIVEERECPSCGGNFTPDSNGCCAYCGYGLKTSNAKWKLKR
ncbi:MAG: hypothetical protein IJJ41_01340 [Clostridia bacterium]|nr:hypothetical protein [Clostridia bacterium]